MRATRVSAFVVTVFLAMCAALPASAAPGDQDPTFGKDGVVLTHFGQVFGEVGGVAIEPNGTIVVGGTVDGRMGAVRYLSDGRLDTSFSGDGRASVRFAGEARGNDMALQRNGKIVVAGAAFVDSAQSVFAVARFRADGTVDRTFSGDGKVTTAFPDGWAEAAAVAVGSDGRIFVVGSAETETGVQIAIACYLPAGGLDPAFGDHGTLTTQLPEPAGFADILFSLATDVAVQPDGRIVITGWGWAGPDKLFVARYLPDGRLDPSFGSGDGIKFSGGSDKSGYALALQPDGKIVVTGHEEQWNHDLGVLDEFFFITRFLSDGRPDQAFGVVRVAEPGYGQGQDVAVAPDGTIVVIGADFSVVRLRPDGTPDATFGNGGIVKPFPDGYGVALAIQPDGRIVAAGDWISVVRLLAA